jgi:hypothetical protein
MRIRIEQMPFIADQPLLKCEACGTTLGVHMHPSMTAYHFEGEIGSPEDPNRPLPLCDNCGEDYRTFWESQWQEYWASVGRL